MCISIENKNSAFTKKQISNEKLLKYSNEIQQVVSNGRIARIQLCGILAEMKPQNAIFGESTFEEYSEKYLGIKKSQAYAMVDIANTFEIVRENGWKPHLTARGGAWTQTQLQALLPMGAKNNNCREMCEGLVARGVLKPSMTVAEIKELVSAERPDAKERQVKKEKRDKNKERIEQQSEKVRAKIKGELFLKFEIFATGDGSYLVWNGHLISDFNDDNIKNFVNALKNCNGYHAD